MRLCRALFLLSLKSFVLFLKSFNTCFEVNVTKYEMVFLFKRMFMRWRVILKVARSQIMATQSQILTSNFKGTLKAYLLAEHFVMSSNLLQCLWLISKNQNFRETDIYKTFITFLTLTIDAVLITFMQKNATSNFKQCIANILTIWSSSSTQKVMQTPICW